MLKTIQIKKSMKYQAVRMIMQDAKITVSSDTYAATISFPILLLRFIFFKFWAS